MSTQAIIGQLPAQQFFCTLNFKGQQIDASNIISLTIREHVLDILPRIDLTIADLGHMIETLTIEDDDILTVSIAKDSESKAFLTCDFAMGDYEVQVQGSNQMLHINMPGNLMDTDMFKIKTRAFKNKSSQDMLKVIAQETGLPFTNPLKVIPSDQMTWYQCTQNNYGFIKHILKRAYVFNDVVLFYATTQNKFVYTSLNKEITKLNYKNAVYNVEQTEIKTDDNDQNIYYNSFDIVNLSALFNNVSSIGLQASYFDAKLGSQKAMVNFPFKLLTNSSFINKDNFGDIVYDHYYGTYNNLNLYSEKYFESEIRNKYLINNFFANSVAIQINADNQVQLFDKINVAIPSIVSSNNQNNVMSGMYLVGGIVHHVSLNGIYKKTLLLNRNGNNASTFRESSNK